MRIQTARIAWIFEKRRNSCEGEKQSGHKIRKRTQAALKSSILRCWSTVRMANEFKKTSRRAKEHSDATRQSTLKHSYDLAKIGQVADRAAEKLETVKAKRRKRENFSQAAASDRERG